jgi:hypothetical protein
MATDRPLADIDLPPPVVDKLKDLAIRSVRQLYSRLRDGGPRLQQYLGLPDPDFGDLQLQIEDVIRADYPEDLRPQVHPPRNKTGVSVPGLRKPEVDRPTFELRDSEDGGWMTLTWRDWDPATTDGHPVEPVFAITLRSPGRINATAVLSTAIGKPLLRFFEELVSREVDWNQEWELRDRDRRFSISCWSPEQGEVRFNISLDAASQDPAWTVVLRLRVEQQELPRIVLDLRTFLRSRPRPTP